jgi:aspartate/methionine/tyrosine aminotransferase
LALGEHLRITQAAMCLAIDVLLTDGDRVLIEDPCFPVARAVVETRRMRMLRSTSTSTASESTKSRPRVSRLFRPRINFRWPQR